MSPRDAVRHGALLLVLTAAMPAMAQAPDAFPGTPGQGPIQAAPADSSMHLQVKPRETQVFVDGYFAGVADNFDGTFQRLHLEPGQHSLQLFLPGHRLYSQDIYLQPSNTFSVRHTMEKLSAGEAEPQRPTGSESARPTPRPPRPYPPPPSQATSRPGEARADTPPPRTAPGDAYGTMTIRVQPGEALVLVDGERWNSTDEALDVRLAPGAHTVEVRKAGFRGYLTEVTVRGGETTQLNIALSPER